MTKSETIQTLINQINSINATYIAIISIIFVLVGIAFSVLTWIQIRMSDKQYKQLKDTIEREMAEKYEPGINGLKSGAISDIYFRLNQAGILVGKGLREKQLPKVSQQEILNVMQLSMFRINSMGFQYEQQMVGEMVNGLARIMLESDIVLEPEIKSGIEKLGKETIQYAHS